MKFKALLRITRDGNYREVRVSSRASLEYWMGDLLNDLVDDLWKQLPRAYRMPSGTAMTVEVTLEYWSSKYHDHYYGGYEYDCGFYVLKSKTLKASKPRSFKGIRHEQNPVGR